MTSKTYMKNQGNQPFVNNYSGSKEPHQHALARLLRPINTRVNCLVAFTVIAIVVGAAALTISVLLLMQGLDLATKEESDVVALQLRVKQLEQMVTEMTDAIKKIGMPSPGGFGEPSWGEGEQGGGNMMLPADPLQPQRNRPIQNAGPQPPSDAHDTFRAGLSGMRAEGVRSGGVGGSIDLADLPGPHYDDEGGDDSDAEGSGDCIQNPPRPACPEGYHVCPTDEPCPKYVCCL